MKIIFLSKSFGGENAVQQESFFSLTTHYEALIISTLLKVNAGQLNTV